jgi:predicted nucleic-acid-binding Zn-ribbon protein
MFASENDISKSNKEGEQLMQLSDTQSKALADYVSRNPMTCPKCGKNDWKFGEIQLGAADLVLGNQEVKPKRPFVEIICRSCDEHQAIDCDSAGIPEV